MACLVDNQPPKATSSHPLACDKQRNSSFPMTSGKFQLCCLTDSCLYKILTHRKLLAAAGKDFVSDILQGVSYSHQHLERSGCGRLGWVEVEV